MPVCQGLPVRLWFPRIDGRLYFAEFFFGELQVPELTLRLCRRLVESSCKNVKMAGEVSTFRFQNMRFI